MYFDFMYVVLSFPFNYRYNNYIYKKWMKEKYPMAAEFGWEKWGGVKPQKSYIFLRKIKTTQRLLRQTVCKMLKLENADAMNPIEYWYQHNTELQRFYEKYYTDNIGAAVIDEELRKDMQNMFENGGATEKSMVLTVLAMVRKYFNESAL